MPAGNFLGYLPPDVQLALLSGAGSGSVGGFGAGLGLSLAPLLQGAAPAPANTIFAPPAQLAAPQTRRAAPRLVQSDLDRIGQMDNAQLMDARKRLKQLGLLTPEVDVHFSRRLQSLNTRRQQ